MYNKVDYLEALQAIETQQMLQNALEEIATKITELASKHEAIKGDIYNTMIDAIADSKGYLNEFYSIYHNYIQDCGSNFGSQEL